MPKFRCDGCPERPCWAMYEPVKELPNDESYAVPFVCIYGVKDKSKWRLI
jgi:hypothetical protein